MELPREIEVAARPLEVFQPLVGGAALEAALAGAARLTRRLGGRPVWNINSTARGGGVAAMLESLLPYARGAGVDARWLVIAGDGEFFRITKRLHNALHGERGDGSSLGAHARDHYEQTLAENAAQLAERMQPGDLAVLHDPQTAGLAPHLLRRGVRVVWRCHVGSDAPTAESERGWRFLLPYLVDLPVLVFSRRSYAPASLDERRVHVVQPSIDPFSPKNEALAPEACVAILRAVGLLEGAPEPEAAHFVRADGTRGEIVHGADLVRLGRPPTAEAPLIVQVSRWDRLKDPAGVISGFRHLVEGGHAGEASLVVAGPNVHAVADDPEGASVFEESLCLWRELPHEVRSRVTLASLPTHDVEENAAMVNALQRHAAIVVQKSLREGFGLTVTEAMWKARPVVASRVGGIQDQIEDGVTGLLLDDPSDEAEFADALRRLLEDPRLARELGARAQAKVRDAFLPVRHLTRFAEIVEGLVS